MNEEIYYNISLQVKDGYIYQANKQKRRILHIFGQEKKNKGRIYVNICT